MEQLRAQVQLITEEISTLKSEVISVKASHANLHQATVESGSQAQRTYAEQAARIGSIQEKIEDIMAGPPESQVQSATCANR